MLWGGVESGSGEALAQSKAGHRLSDTKGPDVRGEVRDLLSPLKLGTSISRATWGQWVA